MIEYKVIDEDGVEGPLIQLAEGQYACPVCGDVWQYPPMMPAGGDLDKLQSVLRYTVGDTCYGPRGCGVEFGVDIPYTFDAFWRWRIANLDEWGWPRWALDQLRNNLGLSEEELRRKAESYRRGKRE